MFEPRCSSNWIMKPPGFRGEHRNMFELPPHLFVVGSSLQVVFFSKHHRRLHWSVSSGQFPQFFLQGSKISPKGQSGPKTSYRQSTYMGWTNLSYRFLSSIQAIGRGLLCSWENDVPLTYYKNLKGTGWLLSKHTTHDACSVNHHLHTNSWPNFHISPT